MHSRDQSQFLKIHLAKGQPTNSIRRHDNFDVLRPLKPIQLIQQLQHGPLHLRVASSTSALTSRATNGINLVHEDDTRRVLSGHDEQLPDHPTTFTDVFLHQLTSTDSDEFAVGMMCHRTRQQSLSRTGRSVEQNALGLGDTQSLEELGVLDGQLDDLLDFFNLFVEPTDHLVGAVGDLLDHHEGDEWINFVGKDFVDGVGVGAEGDTEGHLELRDIDFWVNVDDWESKRFIKSVYRGW